MQGAFLTHLQEPMDLMGAVADMTRTAHLSVEGPYSTFSYESSCIRFRTSDALKRYLDVVSWDNGYLVVMAEYEGMTAPVEEYIDLVPILENLYFDPAEFLEPIEEVVAA